MQRHHQHRNEYYVTLKWDGCETTWLQNTAWKGRYALVSYQRNLGARSHHRPAFGQEENRADLRGYPPLLALHNLLDEWVDVDGQRFFIEAIRERYETPDDVEFHVYTKPTGAPYEHSGFGKFSADAKARQVDFLERVFEMKS